MSDPFMLITESVREHLGRFGLANLDRQTLWILRDQVAADIQSTEKFRDDIAPIACCRDMVAPLNSELTAARELLATILRQLREGTE